MVEFIRGYGMLLGYFAISATSAFLLRHYITLPKEVFRKILHIVPLGSIFFFTYAFKTWWISAIAAIVFIIMVFPILVFAEKRISSYSEILIERKDGEIKRSLVVVFSMFAVLIWICWGWLGEIYLVIASVLAWGLGDAAAALIGKRFGRHYIEGPRVEGRKSLEGTFAMFFVSFISVLIVLLIYSPVVWYVCIMIAVVTGAVCAIVELYTKNGMDTLTCPLAAAAIMIPLIYLLGV